MNDLLHILEETAELSPCGPNLEYDASFLELEQLAQAKSEQQFGDTLIAAEEPDWAAVRESAISLLGRSKDLRPAVLLARALTNGSGIAGLNQGLLLIQQLVERYWDSIHPQLDPDEDNDPTMRLNALAPLVDAEALVRDLRKAWFVRSRAVGQVLVRDVEVALGKLPPPSEGEHKNMDQIEAMVRDCAAEDSAPIQAVRDALQTVGALDSLLSDKLGSGGSLDFGPLTAVLRSLRQVCDRVLGVAAEGSDADGAGDTDGTAATAAGNGNKGAPITGDIRSRDDALRMLDKVCDYLEKHEPTNPAPLLIRRGKRLMTMSFVDIIRDLVPDSIAQVESIAGTQNSN